MLLRKVRLFFLFYYKTTAQSVEHQTCDQEMDACTVGLPTARCWALAQVFHTCLPLSPSSMYIC